MSNHEIFALSVPNDRGQSNYWAFDLFEQYSTARAYLHAMNWPHIAFHKLARDGSAEPLTSFNWPDSKWIDLSEGINDAFELKRHIEETGLGAHLIGLDIKRGKEHV